MIIEIIIMVEIDNIEMITGDDKKRMNAKYDFGVI